MFEIYNNNLTDMIFDDNFYLNPPALIDSVELKIRITTFKLDFSAKQYFSTAFEHLIFGFYIAS